jgi:lysophospholipid acyltransferase (LPLAT)-like uncharacterized protein
MGEGSRQRLRRRLAVAAGAEVLRLAVGLLGASCRLRLADPDALEALRARRQPVILAFWHRQLFLACFLLRRELVRRGVPLTVLVSRSRDGDFGARLGELLGARVVRGSSSRGGGAALRQLGRAVRQGAWPVMVPDGPRGPAGDAKAGPFALARLGGVPVVPIGMVARRSWRLGSWDRTLIPQPFTLVTLAIGAPVEGSGNDPADRAALTHALDAVEARAWQALEDPL